MDRFTAPSTTDWPLPSLPLASLVDIPRENKRHCRILPAGMVSLNLTQMADAAADDEELVRRGFREEQRRKGFHEEQVRRKFHEEQNRRKFHEENSKKLDYKKVESTEHEFEKGAFECKNGEKKRKRKQEHLERRQKIKAREPNSFDEMLESVDALLASLESPVARTIKREEAPEVFVMSEHEYTSSPATQVIEIAGFDDMLESPAVINIEPRTTSEATVTKHTSSPKTAIIEIAELDAYETIIPKPSTQTGTKPASADIRKTGKDVTACKENIITPPPTHAVIDFTTALHSNPPSSTERAFAGNLRNTHHTRKVPALGSHELALPTFDEMTKWDGEGATAKSKNKKKKTKLSFSKAVSKGFREIFGEEGCFS